MKKYRITPILDILEEDFSRIIDPESIIELLENFTLIAVTGEYEYKVNAIQINEYGEFHFRVEAYPFSHCNYYISKNNAVKPGIYLLDEYDNESELISFMEAIYKLTGLDKDSFQLLCEIQ